MKKLLLARQIDEVVRRAASQAEGEIALHEPKLCGCELQLVKECLDSGWVSSVGGFVDRFEQELEALTGARHAIATVNGTAALHVCLLLVGVQPGDEVLLPALSFVATANAVAYCGAIPHFIDSEERTLGVNPAKLEAYLKEIALMDSYGCINQQTGRRIRALIAMHTFGHPVDIEPLIELCDRHKIELIEDAAESLGSSYKGASTGTFGKAAALSFNGNKIITTGGGGAILTSDENLARHAKHLTTTAKKTHRWAFYHDEVGFNYRLPNLNAALGVAQLQMLPKLFAAKRALAEYYCKVFANITGIRFFEEPAHCTSNYWLNVLLLDTVDIEYRNNLLENLNNLGILARPAWDLLNSLPTFNRCPCMDLHVAENLSARIINIPSGPAIGMTLETTHNLNTTERVSEEVRL